MNQNEDNFMKSKRLSWANRILALVGVSSLLVVVAGAFVLWPAYTNPQSQMYSSSLGYLKLERLLGMHVKAEAEHPVYHNFETPILGEGTIQCNFYNVPVVPTAQVKSLLVEEGDTVKKGQVLAELDDSQAQYNYKTAELAFASAKAQMQRVEAGSVNTMAAERPQKDKVDLKGMEKVVKAAKTKLDMYKKMERDGASSKVELVNAELEYATAETSFEQAKISVGMSSQGFPGANAVAQNAVDDAENLLQQRADELKYYRIIAPADGVIDRVLIREGEFNEKCQ